MAARPVTAFLDTHAAVFLWENRIDLFDAPSRLLLENAELRLSPMVVLELAFLREIGRLIVEPAAVVEELAAEVGVLVSADPFDRLVTAALDLTWTRDPFDRLIVATAATHDAPLVTRDRLIREHYPRAVW
jgi:PIN domain nuclease of toxin-antitoxin system